MAIIRKSGSQIDRSLASGIVQQVQGGGLLNRLIFGAIVGTDRQGHPITKAPKQQSVKGTLFRKLEK